MASSGGCLPLTSIESRVTTSTPSDSEALNSASPLTIATPREARVHEDGQRDAHLALDLVSLDGEIHPFLELRHLFDQRIEVVAGEHQRLGRGLILDGLAERLEPVDHALALILGELELRQLPRGRGRVFLEIAVEGPIHQVTADRQRDDQENREDAGDHAPVEEAAALPGAKLVVLGGELGRLVKLRIVTGHDRWFSQPLVSPSIASSVRGAGAVQDPDRRSVPLCRPRDTTAHREGISDDSSRSSSKHREKGRGKGNRPRALHEAFEHVAGRTRAGSRQVPGVTGGPEDRLGLSRGEEVDQAAGVDHRWLG